MFLSPSLKFITTQLTTRGELLPVTKTGIKLYTLAVVLLKEKGELRGESDRLLCSLSNHTTLALPDFCLPHAQFPQGGQWVFFAATIFPQGCTTQVRMHISNLVLCPASLPSTTLRLLNLFLNNGTTQRSPRLSLAPVGFQSLPSAWGHTRQPHSICILWRSWSFQKPCFMKRAQSRHFRGFLKTMITFIFLLLRY